MYIVRCTASEYAYLCFYVLMLMFLFVRHVNVLIVSFLWTDRHVNILTWIFYTVHTVFYLLPSFFMLTLKCRVLTDMDVYHVRQSCLCTDRHSYIPIVIQDLRLEINIPIGEQAKLFMYSPNCLYRESCEPKKSYCSNYWETTVQSSGWLF